MSCSHCHCHRSAQSDPDATAPAPRSPERRSFLALCGAGIALLAWPLRALAERKVAIALDKVPALQRVGGFSLLRVLDREILFIRESESSIRALTAFCSHKRTRLGYDAKKQRVVCSNHGSWFTLDGVVKKGPAEKNLAPVYWCKLDGARKRILLKI